MTKIQIFLYHLETKRLIGLKRYPPQGRAGVCTAVKCGSQFLETYGLHFTERTDH